MLCDVFDKDFSIFFENYATSPQSNNFDKFDDFDDLHDLDNPDNLKNIKSRVQIKLSNGIVLPHEAHEDIFDEKTYTEKYKRRIDRFKNIIYDEKIRKIFIRTDKDELSEKQKNKLKLSLELYKCKNYDIKFIAYSNYKCDTQYTWHRDYIPWSELF